MQVNKVKNKKKFQPSFDWNFELGGGIPLEKKKKKKDTFRPLSTFFSRIISVQTIASTWGSQSFSTVIVNFRPFISRGKTAPSLFLSLTKSKRISKTPFPIRSWVSKTFESVFSIGLRFFFFFFFFFVFAT